MAGILKNGGRKAFREFRRAFGSGDGRRGRAAGDGARPRVDIRSSVLVAVGVAGAAGTCGILVSSSLGNSVKAEANVISLPGYPWGFQGVFSSLDHAAVRRGWQVYKTVCQTCHSLRYVRFADLIDVSHTADEVKAIAAEYQVEDGPDERGENYTREGKPSDRIPPPYPNEEAARAANSGAYPVDLSYILLARPNGQNYVFSLLTGWMDPPAGISLAENQYFNAYFPGGAVAMAQVLYDGAVEYDDGTPATASQMAKDVVEFLTWTSSQDHDTRKLMTVKGTWLLLALTCLAYCINRKLWAFERTRQIFHVPKRTKH